MSSNAIFGMRVVLIFIFLILWGQVVGAQTIVTIDINKSGDTLWTMEKRIPLTKPEINEWETAIKAGQNISRYKDVAEFNDTINLFLRSAQNFSSRSMEIEPFNISNISYDTIKTLSDGFGVTRYSFWWKNFSQISSSKIYIGDAFSEGMALSPDNVLIIKIPDGYKVQDVSPVYDKRDGNSLIWYGTLYRNFSNGEPSLVLTRQVLNNDTLPASNQNTWNMTAVPGVILISGALFIFVVLLIFVLWRRGHSRVYDKRDDTISGDNNPGDNRSQIDNTAVQTDNTAVQADNTAVQADNLKNEVALAQLPDIPAEFLGDEEMIEQHLIELGGQAYQSSIVKKSGLSKSKISIVLAKMKEDGRIIKIRKGKENIIRLVTKK